MDQKTEKRIITESLKQIIMLYQKAEQGDYNAAKTLFEADLQKSDCPITLDEAKMCWIALKKAIKRNFFDSCDHLRVLFLANQFLANTEDRDAQYDLGKDYLYGSQVTSNPENAEKWLKKAAEQGEKWAQYHLFNAYLGQNGFSQNLDEATQLLEKMKPANSDFSEPNFPPELIDSMRINLKRALEAKKLWEERMCLKNLAEKENATSQEKYVLAMNFFQGKLENFNGQFFAEEKREAAEKWFKKAAKEGHSEAASILISYYGYKQKFFKIVDAPPKNSVEQNTTVDNSSVLSSETQKSVFNPTENINSVEKEEMRAR